MSLKVKVSNSEFNKLKGIKKLLKGNNFENLNKAIGQDLAESARLRIAKTKKDIKGKPFAKWKNESYRRRQNKRGRKERENILRDTSNLLNSIFSKANETTITIGSNLPYARRQNFGGGGIARRQFIGISLDDKRTIINTIRNYYKRIFGG